MKTRNVPIGLGEPGTIRLEAAVAAHANALLHLTVSAFQALADPARVRILHALVGGPLYVRDLELVASASASAVSYLLRLVQARRLVRPRRAGNVTYDAVEGAHMAGIFREVAHHAEPVLSGLAAPPGPRRPVRQQSGISLTASM